MNIERVLRKRVSNKVLYGVISLYLLIITILIFKSEPILIYEWGDILPYLKNTGEYRYLSHYSAFMPPLYPYYLYFFWNIIGGDLMHGQWILVSIFIHSIIFLISIVFLCKSILKENLHSVLGILCLSIILFFPSILFGTIRNSSFALTTAIYVFTFCFAYNYAFNKSNTYLFLLLLFGALGLYTRWDFIAYFVLMTMMLIVLQKRKLISLILPFVFVFLVYAPWCYRNYKKIGVFSYNTSSAYNLAKGNNIKFDLVKMSNVPFDEKTEKILTTETLGVMFNNEVARDIYLKGLFNEYIKEHPQHFFKISIGKFFVNLTQYFPESFGGGLYDIKMSSKTQILTIGYSLIFVVYTIILIITILKYGLKKCFIFEPENYFYQFIIIAFIFHFMINTFAAPPLPRYILFYFPFFTVFIFYFIATRLKTKTK